LPGADGVKGSEVALAEPVAGPILLVLGLNGVTRLPAVHDVEVGVEVKGP